VKGDYVIRVDSLSPPFPLEVLVRKSSRIYFSSKNFRALAQQLLSPIFQAKTLHLSMLSLMRSPDLCLNQVQVSILGTALFNNPTTFVALSVFCFTSMHLVFGGDPLSTKEMNARTRTTQASPLLWHKSNWITACTARRL
jgi:hypothetical protein